MVSLLKADSVTISDLPKFTKLSPPYGYKGKKRYNSQICAFDIETTTIKEINQAVMYIWQFAIEHTVIVGRTWEEFKRLIKLLKAVTGDRTTLIFVHNLSYEIVFLSGIFHFDNKDIFPTEPHHVLRANIDNLEFRCSYRLTNLDLNSMTKRYKVKHQKLSGEEFDYTKQRFPWTELTERELEYCVNDVLGLVESIHAILELNKDSLYTLPLTSTGFVRRECKKAMRPEHLKIMECFPDYQVYKLLKAEFRGGNTHGNRFWADYVITEPVTSMDISSSYPSQMCNRLFPCSPFKEVVCPDTKLIDRIISLGKCVLFTVKLENVRLRNRYTAIPYLPYAKCSNVVGEVKDNGRILSAKSLVTTLNEIDWKIIVNQYEFKAEIIQAYKARLGKLPEGLRKCNIEFYRNKTELKGVAGEELFYMKSKELLNGIYGMSVQSPTKPELLFNDGLYQEDESISEEELLIKARKRAFTLYQYGCWTTAHARASLQEGIEICGDDILYVDTDSCKFRGQHDFTAYNEEQKKLSLESGLYATDIKGVTHYGGIFEFDGCYESMIYQGAKKYAYVDGTGLHVTVSGVGKKRGAVVLDSSGGLDAFREGFVFHNCGKTRSIYNDHRFGMYSIEGHDIEITRNVVIEDQDYTLARTLEYTQIIEESKAALYKIMQNYRNVQSVQIEG